MFNIDFFWIAFWFYLAGTLVFITYLASTKKIFSDIGFWLMACGGVLHTIAFINRVALTGHAPLTNMYEYISALAWFSVVAYLIFHVKTKQYLVGAVIGPLAFMLMAASTLLFDGNPSEQLMPALQSYWLKIHVSMAAASEALFMVGFVGSVLYLIRGNSDAKNKESRLPTAEKLDAITYKAIMIGYPLFTIGGLFAGAIWAHKAWGGFWSWDPKETSSLIVWLIYTVYLHTRIVKGWKGKKAAIISIVGFIAALATLFSNMVLGGLHSYG